MAETTTDAGARSVNAALESAALDYLGRYASSSESLRRVLMRRIGRMARTNGLDPDEGARLVAELVARYLANGLLDDAAYARQQALRLSRRGASLRAIRFRLAEKGVARELILAALAALADEGASELAAACALVRRRRLGPCRAPAARASFHERDLGTLARAGYSLAIARRVLGVADCDVLDRLAAGEEA